MGFLPISHPVWGTGATLWLEKAELVLPCCHTPTSSARTKGHNRTEGPMARRGAGQRPGGTVFITPYPFFLFFPPSLPILSSPFSLLSSLFLSFLPPDSFPLSFLPLLFLWGMVL